MSTTAPWPRDESGRLIVLDQYDDDADIDASDQVGSPVAYKTRNATA